MATIPVDSRIDSKTAEFFSRQHRMLIDGRFVPAASGKTFPVYNPATGEVVARVPEAEKEDVNRAVSAARRAFDEGPWSKKSDLAIADSCSGKSPTCCKRTWKNSPRLSHSTTASRCPSRGSPTFPWPSICSATWRAGRPRSAAPRFVLDAGRFPLLHPARARRRRGADHPLEFPAADGGLEACPGARCRLLRGAQNRRADTDGGTPPGRTLRSSRISSRRGQCAHRLR